MPSPSITYREKLLDPRWQKKRLKILSRDRWTCQECGETEKTLHVHHLYYRGGAQPWDYPDGSLCTLCSSCHADVNDQEPAELVLIDTLRRKGFTNTDLLNLGMSFDRMKRQPSLTVLADALGCLFSDKKNLEKVIKYFTEWRA